MSVTAARTAHSILIVDDEGGIRQSLAALLQEEG